MSRPLEGLRVLVTRARVQASDLAERLEALGAQPIVLPSIEFELLEGADKDKLDDALRCVGDYDSVVFTSVRGVNAVENRLQVLGTTITDLLATKRLVAVGNVTAEALRKSVRMPDVVPEEFSAKGILSALGNVSGRRFLLLRADQAKSDLPTGLRREGANVDDVVAYRIVKSADPGSEVLEGPKPDIITFTSSSGVHNTNDRLTQAGLEEWLEKTPIACIGPVTANTVLELGYEVPILAKEATIEGLVASLVEFQKNKEMSHA